MTVDRSVAAMRDRVMQLRVGDHVRVLSDGVSVAVEVVARKPSESLTGVAIQVRGADGKPARWIDAGMCAEVCSAPSFLGERFAAAGKVCTACADWHPLTGFYRAPKGLYGRHASCMRCYRAAEAGRREARRARRAAGQVQA